MAVLSKIKENFGDVSKGAAFGAAMLGAVLTPQFATQAGADEVKLAAVNSAPAVVIEYGSKIVEIEDIEYDMKSLGIPVELKAGYANPSCGRVTVNGKSVEFDQHGVDGGELGSFIHWEVKGKKTDAEDMPRCNADA